MRKIGIHGRSAACEKINRIPQSRPQRRAYRAFIKFMFHLVFEGMRYPGLLIFIPLNVMSKSSCKNMPFDSGAGFLGSSIVNFLENSRNRKQIRGLKRTQIGEKVFCIGNIPDGSGSSDGRILDKSGKTVCKRKEKKQTGRILVKHVRNHVVACKNNMREIAVCQNDALGFSCRPGSENYCQNIVGFYFLNRCIESLLVDAFSPFGHRIQTAGIIGKKIFNTSDFRADRFYRVSSSRVGNKSNHGLCLFRNRLHLRNRIRLIYRDGNCADRSTGKIRNSPFIARGRINKHIVAFFNAQRDKTFCNFANRCKHFFGRDGNPAASRVIGVFRYLRLRRSECSFRKKRINRVFIRR